MSTEKDRLVRERAYHLWEAAGRPDGRSQEYWAAAEKEVGASSGAVKKADPASKPKATASKSAESRPKEKPAAKSPKTPPEPKAPAKRREARPSPAAET